MLNHQLNERDKAIQQEILNTKWQSQEGFKHSFDYVNDAYESNIDSKVVKWKASQPKKDWSHELFDGLYIGSRFAVVGSYDEKMKDVPKFHQIVDMGGKLTDTERQTVDYKKQEHHHELNVGDMAGQFDKLYQELTGAKPGEEIKKDSSFAKIKADLDSNNGVEQDKQKKILINCGEGQSRAATAAIVFLMVYYQVPFLNAYMFLRSKRQIVNPNPSFVIELLKLEETLDIKTDIKNENIGQYAINEVKCAGISKTYIGDKVSFNNVDSGNQQLILFLAFLKYNDINFEFSDPMSNDFENISTERAKRCNSLLKGFATVIISAEDYNNIKDKLNFFDNKDLVLDFNALPKEYPVDENLEKILRAKLEPQENTQTNSQTSNKDQGESSTSSGLGNSTKEILPGLYIGSSTAKDQMSAEDLVIELPRNGEDNFESIYKTLTGVKAGNEIAKDSIVEKISEVLKFNEDEINNSKKRILFIGGESDSTTAIMITLMHVYKIGAFDAFLFLRSIGDLVEPNSKQFMDLLALEKQIITANLSSNNELSILSEHVDNIVNNLKEIRCEGLSQKGDRITFNNVASNNQQFILLLTFLREKTYKFEISDLISNYGNLENEPAKKDLNNSANYACVTISLNDYNSGRNDFKQFLKSLDGNALNLDNIKQEFNAVKVSEEFSSKSKNKKIKKKNNKNIEVSKTATTTTTASSSTEGATQQPAPTKPNTSVATDKSLAPPLPPRPKAPSSTLSGAGIEETAERVTLDSQVGSPSTTSSSSSSVVNSSTDSVPPQQSTSGSEASEGIKGDTPSQSTANLGTGSGIDQRPAPLPSSSSNPNSETSGLPTGTGSKIDVNRPQPAPTPGTGDKPRNQTGLTTPISTKELLNTHILNPDGTTRTSNPNKPNGSHLLNFLIGAMTGGAITALICAGSRYAVNHNLSSAAFIKFCSQSPKVIIPASMLVMGFLQVGMGYARAS